MSRLNLYKRIQDAADAAAIRYFRDLMPETIGLFHQAYATKDGSSVTITYESLAKPGLQISAYLRDWGPIRVELINQKEFESIGGVVIESWEERDEKIRSFVLALGLDTVNDEDLKQFTEKDG